MSLLGTWKKIIKSEHRQIFLWRIADFFNPYFRKKKLFECNCVSSYPFLIVPSIADKSKVRICRTNGIFV